MNLITFLEPQQPGNTAYHFRCRTLKGEQFDISGFFFFSEVFQKIIAPPFSKREMHNPHASAYEKDGKNGIAQELAAKRKSNP